MLDRVTFTGADDSIDPVELVRISKEYPGVEWGILFSFSLQGKPRYPTHAWLKRLAAVMTPDMRLSAHLCGRWVRDFVLNGHYSWRHAYDMQTPGISALFRRVQINFHGEFHRADSEFPELLRTSKGSLDKGGTEFILQCDGVNDAAVSQLSSLDLAVPLFDISGGAGVLPDRWLPAWRGVYCGYAGGLGPHNITQQLDAIAAAAGHERFWIDMERRVRSEDDKKFELDKVRSVLEQVAAWQKRQQTENTLHQV